jgi:hypothetical protein
MESPTVPHTQESSPSRRSFVKTHLDVLVMEAAQNAYENDHRSWSSTEALAMDMTDCDADLEGEMVDDICSSLEKFNVLEDGPQGTKIIRKFWEDGQ